MLIKDGTVYSDTSGTVGKYGSITGATAANPVVITATAHGLATGDEVRIASVGGMTELNQNEYTIVKVDANSFQLAGVDGSAYTAYTSGGTWGKLDSVKVEGEGALDFSRSLVARSVAVPVVLVGDSSEADDPSRVVTTLTQLSGEFATIRDGVKNVRSASS